MKYAVTFGQKYNRPGLTHSCNAYITGQSYVVFEASGRREAYDKMFDTFGKDFAFVYEWKEFEHQIKLYDLQEMKHPVVLYNKVTGETI